MADGGARGIDPEMEGPDFVGPRYSERPDTVADTISKIFSSKPTGPSSREIQKKSQAETLERQRQREEAIRRQYGPGRYGPNTKLTPEAESDLAADQLVSMEKYYPYQDKIEAAYNDPNITPESAISEEADYIVQGRLAEVEKNESLMSAYGGFSAPPIDDSLPDDAATRLAEATGMPVERARLALGVTGKSTGVSKEVADGPNPGEPGSAGQDPACIWKK